MRYTPSPTKKKFQSITLTCEIIFSLEGFSSLKIVQSPKKTFKSFGWLGKLMKTSLVLHKFIHV